MKGEGNLGGLAKVPWLPLRVGVTGLFCLHTVNPLKIFEKQNFSCTFVAGEETLFRTEEKCLFSLQERAEPQWELADGNFLGFHSEGRL